VDSGPGFPEPAREILRTLAHKAHENGMDAVLDAAIKRMFPEPFIASNPEIINRRRQKLSEANQYLFSNAALALTVIDNSSNLSKIKKPTLVILGLEDQATPPELSFQLAQGIKGAQPIELPSIGHCPQLQNPNAFLKAVKPFLGLIN
jgi:3-oxoadipate enol-lactonase